MEMWSQDKINNYFLHQAEDADRYLKEVRAKLESRPAYEHVFDDHMARFYVYNYLHGRTFLSSKQRLLAELNNMLDYEIKPDQFYDIDRFESHRKNYINHEISKLEST